MLLVSSVTVFRYKMPHYKVTYFDARGRGEFVKLVLAAAGQKFDDDRVPFEEWPKVQPGTPWGSMPVLEVDGKQLAQTSAVVRFLGHRYGLIPTGDWEEGLVDSMVEVSFDVFNAVSKILYPLTPQDQKEDLQKNVKENVFPTMMSNIEKFISHHGSHGHCVGSKLTTADICLFCGLDFAVAALGSTVLEPYPKTKQMFDKVRHHEKIAAYLSFRK